MEDIFSEWKLRKFIIAESYLLDNPNSTMVLLTDIAYWAKNVDELVQWCNTNGGVVSGMTVTFDDVGQLTPFLLRWS
jgi:hypothetical protein